MSGREGATEVHRRIEWLRERGLGLLDAWRGRLAEHEGSWFWEKQRRVIGVAAVPSAEEEPGRGQLVFAEMFAEGESCRLVRTAAEPLTDDITLAEAIAMRAEREGWRAVEFTVCLSIEEVRFYEMELPPHMEPEEWHEAAYWELDARLMAEGLDADAYVMACRPQSISAVLLAAAERQYLERLREELDAQGIFLCGIAAFAPDGGNGEAILTGRGIDLLPAQRIFLPAIAAALAVLDEEPTLGLRLQGETMPHRRFRYRRMAAVCCAMTFLVLFVAAFFDARAYFEAERDYKRAEQEIALLQRDERVMKMTARLQQKIQQRDTKAACLMENAMPWYSVMVHLGRPELQTKGVWLKSIALRSDKKVEIRGEALSFSVLSTFLQSFEADRDFFPQGPVLEESAEHAGTERPDIAFCISLSI